MPRTIITIMNGIQAITYSGRIGMHLYFEIKISCLLMRMLAGHYLPNFLNINNSSFASIKLY